MTQIDGPSKVEPTVPSHRVLTSGLVAFVAGLAAIASYTLDQAWQSDRSNFWSVAIPGVLTGAGTLALAAVTVWAFLTQRARDDYIREVDERRAERARLSNQSEGAVRAARRIMSYWHAGLGGEESIRVVNASDEAIVDLRLIKIEYKPVRNSDEIWVWRPDSLEDETDTEKSKAWYRPYLLPAEEAEFRGRMFLTRSSHGRTPADVRIDPRAASHDLLTSVEWSDCGGRLWTRTNSDEPITLSM